jgi:hypothetical protein
MCLILKVEEGFFLILSHIFNFFHTKHILFLQNDLYITVSAFHMEDGKCFLTLRTIKQ